MESFGRVRAMASVLFVVGIVCLNCLPHAACADSVLKSDDTLAICGDSITQMGLYSVFMEEYILMCQPTRGVNALQCGWGGTTAPHFAVHMKDTALSFAPTVATMCYGMNDGGYNTFNEAMGKEYRNGLTKAVQNFKEKGVRAIVIGSPGAVDSFYFKNPRHREVTAQIYNDTLGKLGEIGREVAKAEGVLFADLHTPMMDAMTKSKAANGEKFAVYGEIDGVHATPNGHLVMAYAFLKAMGFDGNIGTITYDAGGGTGTATDGHRVVSAKKGEMVVESSRYPYCFNRGNNHPAGPTASMLPFVPFNNELNRYLLVVRNLASPKAKITWGADSKEFTAAELEKGINLAAEFINNPFVQPFMEVDKAVAEKHAFNVMFIKDYLGDKAPEIRRSFPEKAAALQAVDAGFREINSAMLEKCEKAVKPVTHTIKIEEIN